MVPKKPVHALRNLVDSNMDPSRPVAAALGRIFLVGGLGGLEDLSKSASKLGLQLWTYAGVATGRCVGVATDLRAKDLLGPPPYSPPAGKAERSRRQRP